MSALTRRNVQQTLPCVDGCQAFSRVLALDYDDGPTEGLGWCERCDSAWTFSMLAESDALGVRVFSLASLPDGSFTRAVEACAPLGPPRWPVWVPIWRFPSEDARIAADETMDRIVAQAGAPRFVVAARDLSQGFLSVREVNDAEMRDVQDWFFFLGLAA